MKLDLLVTEKEIWTELQELLYMHLHIAWWVYYTGFPTDNVYLLWAKL